MEERRDGALERFPMSQNLVGFVTKLNAGDDGRGVKRERVSGVSDLWLPENWQFTIIDGYWTGVLGIYDTRLFAVRYLPCDLECFEAEIPNLVNICLLLCLAAEASSTSNYSMSRSPQGREVLSSSCPREHQHRVFFSPTIPTRFPRSLTVGRQCR